MRHTSRRSRHPPADKESTTMKRWTTAALAALMVTSLALPAISEAKRLGGGKSVGMQRQSTPQQAPQTPPAQPAAPAAPAQPAVNPAPAAGATAAATGAAAQAGKRSWLGPIAGLAAGLGIAALLSHFGLGEGFANIVMLLLIGIAAFMLIRFVMRRMAGPAREPAPALATAAARSGHTAFTPAPAVQPTPAPAGAGSAEVSVTGRPLSPGFGAATAPVTAAAATASAGLDLPTGFDLPAFERIAKLIFIRLQAANDSGDLEDLRQFTTPEMFAAVRLELQERGGVDQRTDVEQVDAKVIEFARDGGKQIVSVRFSGRVREEDGAASVAFDEVWHLVKPEDDSRAWAIAGIQQPQ
jgi:predicted lipid-binding transport protein (Tim44 family)